MSARPLGAGERARAALATAATACAIGYALLLGLATVRQAGPEQQAKLFAFEPTRPTPPPPRRAPVQPHTRRAKAAAGAPSLRATATDLVAPPILLAPTPVVTTQTPEIGAAPREGAANVAGSGLGAGGEGAGRGGGGDEGDGYSPPRRRAGKLKDSDYPRMPGEAGVGGIVGVRYAVEPDGRVDDCRITRSSGNDLLDETTCRLIEQRFRYDPSRDPSGRPVRSIVVENHEWVVQHEPSVPR